VVDDMENLRIDLENCFELLEKTTDYILENYDEGDSMNEEIKVTTKWQKEMKNNVDNVMETCKTICKNILQTGLNLHVHRKKQLQPTRDEIHKLSRHFDVMKDLQRDMITSMKNMHLDLEEDA
jgi:hypothetical protein